VRVGRIWKYEIKFFCEISYTKKKATWIGHILLGKGLLQHFIEGKIGGTAREGTRHKHLLDDHKERDTGN
jgi:hypothetical protein